MNSTEAVLYLKERHEQLHSNFDKILEHKDADIKINDNLEIKAGTDRHKGFIVGILIAKDQLGEFPFDINDDSEADDEND